MSTVTPEELVQLWAHEKLTTEMAVGHLLQNMRRLDATIAFQRERIATLHAELQRLAAPNDGAPKTATKRTRPAR